MTNMIKYRGILNSKEKETEIHNDVEVFKGKGRGAL
jgi:hypothetical protein